MSYALNQDMWTNLCIVAILALVLHVSFEPKQLLYWPTLGSSFILLQCSVVLLEAQFGIWFDLVFGFIWYDLVFVWFGIWFDLVFGLIFLQILLDTSSSVFMLHPLCMAGCIVHYLGHLPGWRLLGGWARLPRSSEPVNNCATERGISTFGRDGY